MNPVLIYQNETTLDYNNKFSIDFVDNNTVNYVKFLKKNQYIGSMNCNITKANKTKTTFESSKDLVDKLSERSRELLTKGAAFKNDIDYVTTSLTQNFNLPNIAPQKYKLVLDTVTINNNSFSYQFYDVNDKRQKFAKIYSSFSHFKNGFVFKGEKDPNKDNKVLIQLVDNSKIRFIFSQPPDNKYKIERNLYRDYNAKFVKKRSGRVNAWYSTNPAVYLRAEEQGLRDQKFDPPSFMKQLFFDTDFSLQEANLFPVIGKTFLTSHRFLRPFVQYGKKVDIVANQNFLVHGSPDKKKHKSIDSILDNCIYVGNYQLTDSDKKSIEKHHPDFSFNSLGEYYGDGLTDWKQNDIIYPSAPFISFNPTMLLIPKKNL